ncbi:hypothetical protein K7J14_10350 [Treponema zuelzerae]|uniref:Outer membrane protein beta-barrel domain-containing protein n=1 Tax=Teretinema zuelzerae TaxID=156 RepID=A0AAE3EKE2_9SPIR|nr:hypothetical protein [Teretinema zuelzerae]MCD1655099.1 hypothetical protein [Teretinema zuelzerae]
MKRLQIIITIILIAGLALFSSCSTVPAESRGPLSDAMAQARGDEPDNTSPDSPRRRDPPRYKPNTDRGNEFPEDKNTRPPEPRADEAEPLLDAENATLSFGFRGGASPLSSGETGAGTTWQLLGGIKAESMEFLGFLGLSAVSPETGTKLDESLKGNMGFLSLGAEFRWFPLPERKWLSPWLGFSGGGFVMGWEYENPVTDGGETFTGDGVSGTVLGIPAGIKIFRGERLQFGINVSPELFLFNEFTDEGFENDVFSVRGALGIAAELTF